MGGRDALSDSIFLRAALTYAARGWHVFPLRPATKLPLTKNGVLDASRDEAQLREWWTATPDANIGLATGRSKLVVLDVDGAEGHATLAAWQVKNQPEASKTVQAHTPTGGMHILYAHDGDDVAPGVNVLGPKVDVRAANSYIVVAPSIHPDGGRYEWDPNRHPADTRPAALPAQLHAALTARTVAPERRSEADPNDVELVEDGQDAFGATQAARLASKGFTKDEARAALRVMVEQRFAGGWQGLDPRRPWHERDLDRWLKGAYDKFYEPTQPDIQVEELAAISDVLGALIKTQAEKQRTPTLALFTADQLEGKDIPPIKWIVSDLLPEGVSIFGGKPKTGKSWLALGLAIAVARDEPIFERPVAKGGDVLYLALEDNERRLQSRLRKVAGRKWPKRLTIALEWPRGADAVTQLDAWLDEHPSTALVIIDTLAKVRIAGDSKNPYSDDYALVSAYAKLTQARQLGIVLVTHLRKMDSDDPIDTLQGTMGVTGAADTFYVLKRQKLGEDGMLYYRGREVESTDLPIRFDKSSGLWVPRELDDANTTRGKILRAVEAETWGATPTQVAQAIGGDPDTIGAAMRRMVKDGQLRVIERGKYALAADES